MKDRTRYILKVYKNIFIQVMYMVISFTLGIFLFSLMYTIAVDLQFTPVIGDIIRILLSIKNRYFSSNVYYLIECILSLVIYVVISYKKNKNIALLMESVEIMANGDLDKRVDIHSDDDVGEVADNINYIIERLRNITVEERKAQQTKTDLITNVSHDLRTPLTSIIGYLHLIEEDKYKDEVHLRYYTKIAYEKSKDLNIIINDLFELTKLQNKSLPLNKIDMNLVELINQVISYMECQVNQCNMKVRVNFSNDKLIINADPDKIVRVLENLVNNAIKYGGEGKYIDIVTKKENNNAVVEIINYGESIPESDIPFIFDRFYRVEKSRNRNDGGSGLGLAITKNIVEVHNGTILASSNNNRTIFEINLPMDSQTNI